MVLPAAPASAPPLPGRQALQLSVALVAFLLVNTSAQLLATTLPDVQGDLALSADEASLIASAFTMGVFGGVILAAPLMRAFGLSRYAGACAAAYGALAIACAAAPPAPAFVVLRALQGLAAGGLGPTAFVAVFTLAGRPRLMAGLAALALVLLLPNSLGPALAGPLESSSGWRGLFWIQAIVGFAVAAAAWAWLPRPPLDRSALDADWTAIVLLASGLAALTLALSQGARRFWLESGLVIGAFAAAAAAVSGFGLIAWRRPGSVMNARFLFGTAFGLPVALNLAFRAGFAVTGVLAPQFLITLHGHRPLELSGVFLWATLGQACAIPIVWWLVHRLDGRAVMAAGLMLFAAASAILSQATSELGPTAFRLPMFLVGVGQLMFLVPNLQAGGDVITPADGPTASLAFNVVSTGGVVLGGGMASHLAAEREKYHSSVLGEHVSPFAAAAGDRLDGLTALLETRHADPAVGAAGAAGLVDRAVRGQAWTLALNDTFVAFAALLLLGAIAALCIRPLPPLVEGQRPSRVQTGAPA